MLLSALQSRTAAARTLASRAGRTTLSVGTPAWEHLYSRRAVETRAVADAITMTGIRSVEKVPPSCLHGRFVVTPWGAKGDLRSIRILLVSAGPFTTCQQRHMQAYRAFP